MNALQKTITSKDLPLVRGGLLNNIEVMFEKSDGFSLSSTNKKAVTDVLLCLPGILVKAAPTPGTVGRGFIHN